MNHAAEAGKQPTAHHETVMDVGTERVARVYAEALYRAAEKRGQTEDVLGDLETLVTQVFSTEPQFETFLASSAVDRKRKAEVIHSTFGSRAGELFTNLLLVLNDHERLNLLRPLAQSFRQLRDTRAGLVRVSVRSAVPLVGDQEERLRQEIRAHFRKEPVLETQVDPELLGGMVVRVGDWLYDRSVRTELEDLRNQLIARSSYEIQSGRDRFSTPVGN